MGKIRKLKITIEKIPKEFINEFCWRKITLTFTELCPSFNKVKSSQSFHLEKEQARELVKKLYKEINKVDKHGLQQ